MVRPAQRQATYADLLAAPPGMIAELLDGDLYLQPRPAKPHAVTASVLGAELLRPFHLGRGGPGGWWIIFEPEIHLGAQVLVPDLAGWRRAEVPILDTKQPHFEEVPAWICEVLSPSTQAYDRVMKLRAYARAGVQFAWIVDPVGRTLEVFERFEERWILAAAHTGEEVVRARPFEAIELELPLLWLPEEAP